MRIRDFFLSLVLVTVTVFLCLLATPTKAQAAIVDSGTCGTNLTWTLDDAGTLTISGTGAMKNYSYYSNLPWYARRTSIKTVVIGNGVTSIGDYAFYSCDSLTSITIPDSVASIGEWAFVFCDSLTSITIPDSVTSIGNYAFTFCDMTSVTIGNGVTSIGSWAFISCYSLTSVTIGNSVTSIGYDAFYYCDSLTSITIPDSVTSIGDGAFDCCYSLKTVYYSGSQSQWKQISIGDDNDDLTSANIEYNHIHDYTLLPVTTVEPTCTEVGYREYTCMFGETYRESIPALGHDYSGTVVVIAPTCTATGHTNTQCIRCDSVQKSDVTDPIGHKMAAVPAVAATCTQTGLTAGTVCERCNLVGVAQTITPMLEHNYAGEQTVIAPACTELGYTITKCTGCNSTQYSNFTPAGHNYAGEQTVIAPTCTEQGYTITQCTGCDSTQRSDYKPAAHNYAGEKTVVAPSCTEGGYTVTKCTGCDSTTTGAYVDALGHVMVTLPEVAATCLATGLTAGTACDRCGLVGVAQTETPLGDHNFVDGACSVCALPEREPGDLDNRPGVDTNDVIQLLLHVSMPGQFPVNGEADFNGDGQVTTDDVIQLLLHVSMPDMFPLHTGKKED